MFTQLRGDQSEQLVSQQNYYEDELLEERPALRVALNNTDSQESDNSEDGEDEDGDEEGTIQEEDEDDMERQSNDMEDEVSNKPLLLETAQRSAQAHDQPVERGFEISNQ